MSVEGSGVEGGSGGVSAAEVMEIVRTNELMDLLTLGE